MATPWYRKWAVVVVLQIVWWRNCDLAMGLALDPVGDPCSAVWPGAQYHDNYCYKVIEDKIQWHQLENHCTMTKCSAEPAQPMTSEALHFVKNLALMKSAEQEKGSLYVWVGANRNTSNHPLRWTCTNQEVDITDETSWFELNIGVVGGASGEDMNCLALDGPYRKTHVVNCLENGYALCQMRFGKPCEYALSSDAVLYADSCLKYHDEKVTLDEAQATCESEGAILSDITSFTHFRLLRRIDSEMNGEESILVLPGNKAEKETVHIPVSGRIAHFVISVCGDFTVTLTSDEEPTMFNTVQIQLQSGGDTPALKFQLCRGVEGECGDLIDNIPFGMTMGCDSWLHIELNWEMGYLWKMHVNNTVLPIDGTAYKVVSLQTTVTLGIRSMDGAPGLVRYKVDSSTEVPSTWLGTYRDPSDGILRWSSNTLPVELDETLYRLEMSTASGLLYMNGMERRLKADGKPSERRSFICQKRIHENTHFYIVAPSDVNKTLAITTEVKVAIMISIIDSIGMLSMKVINAWLTKGHPITMKLSDNEDPNVDPEDTTRTLTVFSTHPKIALTLFSTDQDDNKVSPVIPTGLLSHTYLVTTLAKYGKIEIMAIMEGETIVNFNCSHYTNLWVFLEDNIIKDPKSGVIPMYYTEKVLMELHSDRIWLRIEASQPISLLTSEDGQMVSILPEQEATSQYASVPSYPLSSSSDDTFTILALEDDLVQENGTSLFTTLTADDMQVVTMESGSYHTITSTNNVYITKLDEDNEPVGTCSVSNQEYDQIRATHEIVVSSSETGDVITLLAIVEDHMASTMLLNDEPEMMTCETISNSSSIGCRTEIQPGFYTLTSTTAEPFQAYVTDSNLDGLFCQYMGSSPNTNTRKKRAVSDGTDKPYRTEVYITAPPQPTQGTDAPPPEEEEDCQRLGTCPKPIEPRKFLNVSVGELVKIIRNDLAVDEKETSAYKRKKISIPDHRFSSKAIGSAGVVFVAFAISVVVFLDCMKLARVMSNGDVVHELKKDGTARHNGCSLVARNRKALK